MTNRCFSCRSLPAVHIHMKVLTKRYMFPPSLPLAVSMCADVLL